MNGSRVDEIIKFKYDGSTLNAEHISGGDLLTAGPVARASMSLGITHDKKLYMFGGQEDDNRKLQDAWCYDCETNVWTEVPIGANEV